ncbi:hypothetical protein POM88_050330 [Heracleum sosnowskyi]|uniref:Serine/threonine specific protein phosphatases domain-containing protein n=1 Tax=Heracleum sosnowskyi TaxID=360622 RepID=A0AAD8GZK4_9APIA|nr:hypothetical protein POM88_050330 [Heracleum sosnowskyi]
MSMGNHVFLFGFLSIHLARGDHEINSMNKIYGFEGEVKSKLNDTFVELFAEVFCCLPLAHVLNGKVFVVHGGLFSVNGVNLSDIRKIDRFCEPPEEGIHVCNSSTATQLSVSRMLLFLTTSGSTRTQAACKHQCQVYIYMKSQLIIELSKVERLSKSFVLLIEAIKLIDTGSLVLISKSFTKEVIDLNEQVFKGIIIKDLLNLVVN